MNKSILGMIGLSGLLLLGPLPGAVLAHEGHDHGAHHRGYSEQEGPDEYEPQPGDKEGNYSSERKEAGRYAPQGGDEDGDDMYDEDGEDEEDRPSVRHYSPSEQEQSSPREWRGRSR